MFNLDYTYLKYIGSIQQPSPWNSSFWRKVMLRIGETRI